MILQREYITRVRKKAFLILSFLGPLIFLVLMIVPAWLTVPQAKQKEVVVIDQHHILKEQLEAPFIIFSDQEKLNKNKASHLIILPPDTSGAINANLINASNISSEERQGIEQALKLAVAKTKLNASLPEINLTETRLLEKNAGEAAASIALFSAILVYFFIFLYGVQVMKSIIEEKANRILEVVVSSVTPFQLMVGKILGVALVSLTQFLIWVITTFTLSRLIFDKFKLERFSDENISQTLTTSHDAAQAMEVNEMLNFVGQINFGLIIPVFIFFFLVGYLFYSSLFAAIGAASDAETDTQQFMLPITLPLIFSFIMAPRILEMPDSTLAQILSYIPFTSPVVMMLRIPFGIPFWEIALSMIVLFSFFLLATLLAAKIYRVGILMYGKNATWKEVFRWLSYKD
ncbi:ABC transporter permease [Sporocytophaga myxococcoides]|uniref:ABC transporter permease n=1 Tax=Sporocytophaga myxococcoides TaxID=153721 RepID=A0A098LA88_9BACT|nr:ABC transporter permease [Sporocytophaga myxococcoides]